MEPRVFVIPSPNLARFEERFQKLVKRANKIGCVVPSYTTVKEEPKTIQVEVGEHEDEFGRRRVIYEDRIILLHHITFNSSEVVVAGYEFAATIDHTEEGNILHTRPGFDQVLPKKYRECGPWCDHCKTSRRRNDTFVVRHVDTDTYLQVGRNCLVDFLGQDAERHAAQAELYFEVGELAEASEEEGFGGCGGGGSQYEMLDTYLSHVSECIRRHGWKSRSSAKEDGGTATADIAYRHHRPTQFDVNNNLLEWRVPTPESLQEAKLAIEWCCDITEEETEKSDYLHNIRVIARRGIVAWKQLGYAASIVSGYQRHRSDLVRKQKLSEQAATSNYVGTVGERQKFTLTVDHVIHLDGDFGPKSLHLMYDKDGNRFTWSSTSVTLEKGNEYLLKGTVKQHQEYKGVKQTQLSRCEVVELHDYTCMIGMTKHTLTAESDKIARKILCETLGMKRLPHGTLLTEMPKESISTEV